MFVEFDPQGDAGDDLGYKRSPENDQGAHMLEVLDEHKPLQPVLRGIRPNLDVVPMGREALKNIEDVLSGKERRGTEYRLMLAEALAPLAREYDLIVIDTPPTRPVVLQLVLGATRWLLVPTEERPLQYRQPGRIGCRARRGATRKPAGRGARGGAVRLRQAGHPDEPRRVGGHQDGS